MIFKRKSPPQGMLFPFSDLINPGEIPNVSYHIIRCPKYRRKVLVGDVETRLKELLMERSEENGWEIKRMEVMPDHVHIFVKATPSDSPAHIASQLKGYTSFKLREEFHHLKKRIPTLWTRSYYVESIGHISEKTILKYIEDQKKNKHQEYRYVSVCVFTPPLKRQALNAGLS